MNIVIPFISHVEKKITPEQAIQIAAILGLPLELSFLSLTIDEGLNMRAFARGIAQEHYASASSVPFNWMQQSDSTPTEPNGETIPIEPPAPSIEPENQNENVLIGQIPEWFLDENHIAHSGEMVEATMATVDFDYIAQLIKENQISNSGEMVETAAVIVNSDYTVDVPEENKVSFGGKCTVCGNELDENAGRSNLVVGVFCSTECCDYAEKKYMDAFIVKSTLPDTMLNGESNG